MKQVGESSVKVSIGKGKSLDVALEKQRLDHGLNRRLLQIIHKYRQTHCRRDKSSPPKLDKKELGE